MPSIFQKLKNNLVDLSPTARASAVKKLPNIYENAEDKQLGAQILAKLDLPRYQIVNASIADFLANPDRYFKILKSERYFPSVMDPKTGTRHFKLDLDKVATISFLKNLLHKGFVSKDYLLTLAEYQENAFSGNITINPPLIGENTTAYNCGEINIELVDGIHAGLAYGDKSPLILAKNDLIGRLNFTVSLKYGEFSEDLCKWFSLTRNSNYIDLVDLKDQIARNANETDKERLIYCEGLINKIIEVLNLIPKDVDNGSNFSVNGKTFHPGYYEFIINPKGSIYFLDYRDPLHYSNMQDTDLED